ncbi:permease prefix domain 1-containing protein [Streptomyces sp. DSM 44915]|uniref:Permease prefix domain 1-containing protein n=1 Tax=Streptomyces chisholmiae TaxID=3075540 RepID=A0ABU2K067_9ACTN|nr:permease prefix domain 1-containing protein [Streptomyces sp. DSM 44915]MDT0270472.1 permease prefix domain 1-containing protein [Streptomyces sp. DSM 44915]
MTAPDAAPPPPAGDAADPGLAWVAGYRARLAARLHGPPRAKARLVEEIADGLADTLAARLAAGLPADLAAHQAEREFGTPEELAPSCQRELTIAQARHTAWAVALTAPLLLACWYLLGNGGLGRPAPLAEPVRLAAFGLAGLAGAAALGAVLALGSTGSLSRWLPVPAPLPRLVAWLGTTASAAMAGSAVTLLVAATLATDWPLVALAGAASAGCHATVAASARACRRCARLPRLA